MGPEYDIAFRSNHDDRRRLPDRGRPKQVAADLLGGPGRNPPEGEEFIAWMQRREREWRDEQPDRRSA
ncbi:MAG TPA: hypothetical protein VIW24_25745 [Aldersonia sp.]